MPSTDLNIFLRRYPPTDALGTAVLCAGLLRGSMDATVLISCVVLRVHGPDINDCVYYQELTECETKLRVLPIPYNGDPVAHVQYVWDSILVLPSPLHTCWPISLRFC
eukprot:1942214-Rhodomonas_salina.3